MSLQWRNSQRSCERAVYRTSRAKCLAAPGQRPRLAEIISRAKNEAAGARYRRHNVARHIARNEAAVIHVRASSLIAARRDAALRASRHRIASKCRRSRIGFK